MNWDNSHWIPEGRNIYFFRDLDHYSEEVHEQLLNAICSLELHVLFIEGHAGVWRPDMSSFADEESLREFLRKEYAACDGQAYSSAEILAYRRQNELLEGQFSIVGVDDMLLHTEQGVVRARIKELSVKFRAGTNSEEEWAECESSIYRSQDLSRQRSLAAVENIVHYYTSHPITNAGLEFGDGHFEEIIEGLQENGFGYAAFLPEIEGKTGE